MLLAGDIGGTKVDLGVFSPDTGPHSPRVEGTLPSARYTGLAEAVRAFLGDVRLEVEQAVFGVPGPVVGGRATGTNLPWVLDEEALRSELGLRSVRLVNDLQALANAVPVLEPRDLHTLNVGQPEADGALAVMAPGTGLGEGYLIRDGDRYRAQPSEGGHSSFAPNSDIEGELWAYLRARFGHVSAERVCSGRGLPNLYRFLRDTGRGEEPEWLAQALAEADDPTIVIRRAGMDQGDPLCLRALELLAEIMGAEAGNLALKVLATGGVYLGGGMPRRMVPILSEGGFMRAFTAKGRLSELLERMPVHVILHPRAALLGAAWLGLREG